VFVLYIGNLIASIFLTGRYQGFLMALEKAECISLQEQPIYCYFFMGKMHG
jgi:hypothetical protein